MDIVIYIIIFAVSFILGGIIWGIIYYSNYKGYKNKYKVTLIVDEKKSLTNEMQKGKFVDFYTPKKDGKKFIGWYDNENCEGKSINYYMVYDIDVTFYAKWDNDEKLTPHDPS